MQETMIAAGPVIARFVHYVALSVLFGGAAFPLYSAQSAGDADHLRSWLRTLLLNAAILTLLSCVAWPALTGEWRSDAGRAWALRVLLTTALLPLLLPPELTRGRSYAVLIGSLALLASLALTGHAWADTSRAGLVHRIADAFHLLASGIWVGALVVLARMALTARKTGEDDIRMLHHAASEFSGVGTVVVAVLVLTGFMNPGFFLAGFRTTYDEVLLAKLGFFGLMLLLAAANRFWLTPRLSGGEISGASGFALRALGVSIFLETALAALVLGAVAILGVLPPP